MKRHYYHDAIERELADWPGVTFAFGEGAKHPFVTLVFNGASKRHVFPSTPSDARGALNAISDMRRTLSAMGAKRNAARRAPPRERRNVAPPRETRFSEADRVPAPADPFAVLVDLRERMLADTGPWYVEREADGRVLGRFPTFDDVLRSSVWRKAPCFFAYDDEEAA